MRLSNPFKQKPTPKNPIFHEGELAFYNGVELENNPYSPCDGQHYPLWDSGWKSAAERYRTFKEHTLPYRRGYDWEGNWYKVGFVITALLSFIASWIYAWAQWGFLLGLGLGWIPSIFIALIAGFLWPLLALALIVFFLFILQR